MHSSLTIYNNRVLDFINPHFTIEVLANYCEFTEGPLWNKEGFYLFSDIPANVIYKIYPGQEKRMFIKNSGWNNNHADLHSQQTGSNALAYDLNENLLICQHGNGSIARYDGKQLYPFINQFQNKPFNSPNDLCVHPDGKIFFSDPPYGLKDSKLNPEKFQPLAGVYCWYKGILKLVSDKYQYPNGVCLSPDKNILYISSNKPFENFISAYDARSYQFLKIVAEENSDGIKCDKTGNFYLCNKAGIIILDADGKRMGLISLPSIPANCCFGGNGLKDLFITARENVFLVRNFLA